MNAQSVFTSIQSHFDKLSAEEKKQALSKINASFQFDLKNSQNQESSYLLDFKNPAQGGKVVSVLSPKNHAGTAKPDITLQTSEATFLELASGKLQGQKAFMAGKLKVKGNMMLASRLDGIFKMIPRSTLTSEPRAKQPSGGSDLASQVVFKRLQASLQSMAPQDREQLVKKTKAVFLIQIKDTAGQLHGYHLDLKKDGAVLHGADAAPVPDVTLIMADQDFVHLVEGKLSGQKAFASGKLKVKGQMMLATKLEDVLKSIQKKAKL